MPFSAPVVDGAPFAPQPRGFLAERGARLPLSRLTVVGGGLLFAKSPKRPAVAPFENALHTVADDHAVLLAAIEERIAMARAWDGGARS